MVDVLLIGHSHTQCIVGAMQGRALSVGWGHVGMASGESPLVLAPDGNIRLQPAIADNLRQQIDGGTRCVSTVAGNAHNVLALIESDPPFDFRMPGDPSPLRPGAVPVPYGSVSLALETALDEGDLAMLRATKAAVPEMRIHIESPPPLRDDELVRTRLDPYFLETYPEARVSAARLRLKIWRLHSRLFARACEKLGMAFVPAPKAAQDRDGFLLPDYAHPRSSTHANEAYGALVADQIEALLQ